MDISEIFGTKHGLWYHKHMTQIIADKAFKVSIGVLLVGMGLQGFGVPAPQFLLAILAIIAGASLIIRK